MTIRIGDAQFIERLTGSSLVTARITYRFPDYLHLLQEFWWQEVDVVPEYPKLEAFLDFWDANLEGPIHSVVVAHIGLLTPAEIRSARRTEFSIH